MNARRRVRNGAVWLGALVATPFVTIAAVAIVLAVAAWTYVTEDLRERKDPPR